jgi:hypothetical protein
MWFPFCSALARSEAVILSSSSSNEAQRNEAVSSRSLSSSSQILPRFAEAVVNIFVIIDNLLIVMYVIMGVLAKPHSRKRRGISQRGSGQSGEVTREEHGNNRGSADRINLKAQRQY